MLKLIFKTKKVVLFCEILVIFKPRNSFEICDTILVWSFATLFIYCIFDIIIATQFKYPRLKIALLEYIIKTGPLLATPVLGN